MQTQWPGHGGWASVISLQLVGMSWARTAAAVWSLAPGSLLRTQHLTQGLGLVPGAWHCAGSWEDMQDPVQNTAMGEMAKRDGKVPQQYSSLPGPSCDTRVSQRSLLRAATKFPMAHAFLSTMSMSPGWLGMPHKGYRCKWDSGEECKDKELCNLCIAHLHKTSGGCSLQPPAFAPITSVATFSCTTGFTLSLFKRAGL